MPSHRRSPYEVALGAERERLHPALQRYFATIPAGSRGVGEGVFDQVGTPRRWLWPVLRVLERRGVIAACWARDVPFRVVNRTVAGRAVAARELRLPGGTWTMHDDVRLHPSGGVTDRLGRPALVSATFDIATPEWALELTSRRVGVALGPWRVTLPRLLAPVVRLRESHDGDDAGTQRVQVTVDHPVLGRLYAYGGAFTYRIEQEEL